MNIKTILIIRLRCDLLRNILIESLKQTPLESQKMEIVERKGLGHPDYICDAVMDRVSVNLSKEYLEKFGVIMHHNVDKSLLVAGEVETRFGGGSIKKPMLLIFGDRATFEAEGVRIPVREIAIQTNLTRSTLERIERNINNELSSFTNTI